MKIINKAGINVTVKTGDIHTKISPLITLPTQENNTGNEYQHIVVDTLPATTIPNTIYFEKNTNTIYVVDNNDIITEYGKTNNKKYYFFWEGISGSITSNVWQRVSFRNKIIDNDNVFDGSIFRPIENGIYVFGGLLTFNMQDAQKLILAVYKNGSYYGLVTRGTTGKADYSGFSGLITIPMVVGDFLELYVYTQSGLYAPIQNYNYIQGWKL